MSDCLFVVVMDSGGPEMVVHTPAGARRVGRLGRADGEESWDELGRRRDKNRVMALQTDEDRRVNERTSKLETKLEKYKEELEAYKRREEMRNCAQVPAR